MVQSYINQGIAEGVKSAEDDTQGGTLIEELVAGANVNINEIDAGGGNKKVQISSTGGAATTYTATTDPTADNDGVDTAGIGRNFFVGDFWVNIVTLKSFQCVDNSTGAAVWNTSASSGGNAVGVSALLAFDGSSSVIKPAVTGRAVQVIISVDTAWDGGNEDATIEVGDDTDNDRLVIGSEVDLNTVGIYVSDVMFDYVATDIEYYYTPDSGSAATQGSCRIEAVYHI